MIRHKSDSNLVFLGLKRAAENKREWTWAGPVSAVVIVAAVCAIGWMYLQ